jgi:hypothetical protein
MGCQAYWLIDKIRVRLAAGDAPVAVKCRAVNTRTSLKSSLYMMWTDFIYVMKVAVKLLVLRNK